MKIIELNLKIMKIMIIQEFHARILQNHKNLRILWENHESIENLRIPYENHEIHENPRIPFENQ